MGSLVQPIPYQGSKRKITRETLGHFRSKRRSDLSVLIPVR